MLEDECINFYKRLYWPPDVELQGGSLIVDAAVCKDWLNDELLLIVLSYSQRIGADGIVDERAKVVDVCRPR